MKTNFKCGDKLYIVVRGDMSPGSQIAQSCHALRQFVEEHPGIEQNWFDNSNFIAILGARSEDEFMAIVHKAQKKEIPHSLFIEPDFDDMITSIALAPGFETYRICSSLPLALKDCKKINNMV